MKIILKLILLLTFIVTPSCESIINDFFKIGCEVDNTCEITIINLTGYPIYADVTYLDNKPNDKRLIPTGRSTKYIMTWGDLVAWASDASEGTSIEYGGYYVQPYWSKKRIYAALCQKYYLNWRIVYQTETK